MEFVFDVKSISDDRTSLLFTCKENIFIAIFEILKICLIMFVTILDLYENIKMEQLHLEKSPDSLHKYFSQSTSATTDLRWCQTVLCWNRIERMTSLSVSVSLWKPLSESRFPR